ncbi:ABC transporter permease [Longispora albida]|uniref:ABC transporter permease n=1 Tax=Longispora albida TaxID=203523 RepID=UPI000368EAED|nr:ABC transporter permease subunit [Longispora albida]
MRKYLPLLPFLVIVGAGLVVPVGVLATGASSLGDTMNSTYGTAMLGSLKLSLVTAVLGAVIGTLLAQAVVKSRSTLLRRVVTTASGVLANFGGVPLAFAFIATIGNAGIVTKLLGLGQTGFTLYDFSGLTIVYLYFLVPLMVLVVLPALDAVRPQWSEAAASLGGSRWHYWRHVGAPVLAPPVAAGALLLFCGAFSAFATAAALVGGSVPLLTLQIADVLSGNVIENGEGIGAALAIEMLLVVGVVMIAYWLLQRRTSRWLR